MRAARGLLAKVSGAGAAVSVGGATAACENKSSRAMSQITIGVHPAQKKNQDSGIGFGCLPLGAWILGRFT